ncbi:MAG: N-acetylneuraminate synthase family protein, partial [Butyrivibrio sp.]|uniref:N-acetylneuraminate synthase family protein n=1 Tax=Butyrivibrio sp. TaxID=28121 RepID=UPI0025CC1C76
SKHKPIIMSVGMATEEEIREALDAIHSQGNDQVAILKCCNVYPTVSSDLNLKTIPDMINKFGVPVGLSDHSMGYAAAVGAAALGARVIEKHFCISRDYKTADSAFSMEPDEYKSMVENVRAVTTALGEVHYGPTDNEISSGEFGDRRSLFVVEDIKAGEEITSKNVRSIRPNAGLAPKYYDDILGKHAKADIKRGTPMAFELVE